MKGSKKVYRTFKGIIKRAISECLKLATARKFSGDKIYLPILCYHSIGVSDNYEGDSLSPENFEAHLKYLTRNYTILPLSDAVDFIKNGVSPPNASVVLTFDDGYVDNYTAMFPLLVKYNVHATVFVVTQFIENEIRLIEDLDFDPLTVDQLREMEESGLVSIEAHTDTHPCLGNISHQRVEKEIVDCAHKIEHWLHKRPLLFAYPNGQLSDYSPYVRDLVKVSGFKAAVTTMWRSSHSPGEQYDIGRLMVSGSDNVKDIAAKVRGDYDFIYYLQILKHRLNTLLRRAS